MWSPSSTTFSSPSARARSWTPSGFANPSWCPTWAARRPSPDGRGSPHEATQAGAFAAFAFPLQVGTAPFGTVELCRSEPGALSERDTAIAVHSVDELVSAVLDDLTGRDRRIDSGGATPVPLFGRAEIPQATGMIAVQLGVTIPEALAQLRAAAFAAHRPILDIAEDVIARRLVFSDDRR